MREWFVLRTQFQQEQRASRELSNQSIKTFLPLARSEYRRKDGLLLAKLRPLFSGYLFAYLNWFERYPVLSTKGIRGFVGYMEGTVKAPTVSKEDIEELRLRLEDVNGFNVVNLSSRPKPIEPGMMAQILFGPFRDHIVPVKAVHGSRVEVLLQFAGLNRSAKLPADCLAAA